MRDKKLESQPWYVIIFIKMWKETNFHSHASIAASLKFGVGYMISPILYCAFCYLFMPGWNWKYVNKRCRWKGWWVRKIIAPGTANRRNTHWQRKHGCWWTAAEITLDWCQFDAPQGSLGPSSWLHNSCVFQCHCTEPICHILRLHIASMPCIKNCSWDGD